MGKNLMNQTDAIRGLKVSEKAILDHLARTANDETGLAWLKQETLAERLNCCLETVRKGTNRLERLKHISRLYRKGKTTLYLVHPNDGLVLLPKLSWSVVEQHIKKGHFPHSFYPNIAGWLAWKGVISDDEATNVLAKFYQVKARKKRRSASPETFAQVQKNWGHTLKKLGLDPQAFGADPPAVGEEYEKNKKENTKENIKSEDTAIEPRTADCINTAEGSSAGHQCNQLNVASSSLQLVKRSTASLVEGDQSAAEAHAQHILAGVNRPDRYSFISDQTSTKTQSKTPINIT